MACFQCVGTAGLAPSSLASRRSLFVSSCLAQLVRTLNCLAGRAVRAARTLTFPTASMSAVRPRAPPRGSSATASMALAYALSRLSCAAALLGVPDESRDRR